MKITKFAQSCILVETKGKKILIDPGTINYSDELLENNWINIDVILVTHKHSDHCNPEAINSIIKRDNSEFYTSSEVDNSFPELSPKIVKEGDIIDIEEIKIEVVKAVHGFVPSFKGGKEIKENIGFIINDDKKKAYITSDTIGFKNDYKCDIYIAPITNHGIVMGPYEAALFAKDTGAELFIPIHYDNPKYQVDIEKAKEIIEKQEVNYELLKIGESIEA